MALAVGCVPTDQQAETGDSGTRPADPLANKRMAPPVRSAMGARRIVPPRLGRMDAAPMPDGPNAAGAARLPSFKPPPGASRTPVRSPAVAAAAAMAGGAAPKPAAAAPDAAIASAYWDTFDRTDLGPEWNATSPEWRIQAGRLCGRNAKNHGVWLTRKLPVNARIEFDAVSTSQDGDLKVELWGDGKSFAKGTSYNDATSYLAIFGGWHNQFHVLARLDEHAKNRPEVKVNPSGSDPKARPVQPGASYHFKIVRADGKTVQWFIDDIEIISFADGEPLKGEGHEHLGFNDWEAQVCFDNLQVIPISGG